MSGPTEIGQDGRRQDAVAASRRRLVVRVKRIAGVPVFAARAWVRGGARAEEIPGQALVAGRLLAEGTRHRSWDRIAREAEDLGMVVHSFGTHETQGVAIDALADDWERALTWLAELVFEPSFPPDRFDWLRRQAGGELEGMLDRPDVRTAQAFLRQLYHPHPYSRALQGDAESLARLRAEDCADLHRRSLVWGGLVVVTGELDEEAVRVRIGELFAALDGEAGPLGPVAPLAGLPEARLEVRVGSAGGDQAHLYAGHLTVPRHHPDMIPLAVIAVVLGAGAGVSGRLPDRIREKEALAYQIDVATGSGAGLDPGRLTVYVATSPRTVDRAERAVRDELERLVAGGVTEEEFEEARSYLIGHDPFRRETARQWAEVIAEAEFYGLRTDSPEWVVEVLGKLTREDVDRAARRWIRPSELKVTVGLPG